MAKDLKIWMNGRLVPQAEAVLPVNSAAVFYATNVFEGLRAYWNEADGEVYCFRLGEHFARLRESMKMMRFTVPYTDMDLYEAVREVLRGNDDPRGRPHAPGRLRGRPPGSTRPPRPGSTSIPGAAPASSTATGSAAASPRGSAPATTRSRSA